MHNDTIISLQTKELSWMVSASVPCGQFE